MNNEMALRMMLDDLNSGKLTYKDGKIYKRNGKELGSIKSIGTGYLVAFKMKNGKSSYVYLHRLIYAYFHGIDELFRYDTVDHINHNTLDNRIENLQGLSRAENSRKKLRNDEHKPKLTDADVAEIRNSYVKNETSVYDIAEKYGVKHMTIWRVLNYKTYKHLP